MGMGLTMRKDSTMGMCHTMGKVSRHGYGSNMGK